jgi:glucose/arabinose dehydrogenase
VSEDPNVAEPAVVEEILFAPADGRANYGGHIAFGQDGMLYAAFGDMDAANNPTGSAQSLDSLSGKLIRMDVGDAPGDYSAPADNPFVGEGREEIWAYGLRQPWRWSFDSETGDIYIGDVGHAEIEEINALSTSEAKGKNFGWAEIEGPCEGDGCKLGAVEPVHQYAHEGGAPRAVIGGYVYRGSAMPCLRGRYFYSDHETGDVSSFVLVGGQAAGHEVHAALESTLLSAFGQDGNGELYLIEFDLEDGSVFRLAPP